MKVIVIGLGAMGSAALAHLARRGVEAVGIDPHPLGHDRGSSHGWSRVIRRAYFEHPDYVPLLDRAFTLWDELEAETGIDIVHRPGVLIVGGPNSQAIERSRASAELHGLETHLLGPSDVEKRFPQFDLPKDYIGLLEPGAGFAIPEHGNAAHVSVAKSHGAEIHATSVLGLAHDGESIHVHTADGDVTADHAIVAAGAWTGQLIPSLAAFLQPQRKVLAWFDQPTTPIDDPAWLIDDGSPRGVYYGVPTWPNQVGPLGVKVGFHGPGPSVLAGVRDEPDPAVLAAFARDMARWRPDLGEITSSVTCTYTMSPDEHFLLGTLPQQPYVTVACGFSGHGYKFAPVIGEVLADLAMGRRPASARFLRPERFSNV